ncbi:hypothetical protein GUJ93_ZPchr0008g13032 [Zizania palustris]|uniref:Uncharacterized protein n=1 Tax=Zizania palustris TaxID=103762 RepID=A0A8J5R5D2_ZIZPA|nr:hypothetical protein GUJ93_ZPchr0008g13032 [Zizania palustris]KAG8046541.1 hypothetical protein GUJ93_ZPchr0008g13032 [Zizania palustris]
MRFSTTASWGSMASASASREAVGPRPAHRRPHTVPSPATDPGRPLVPGHGVHEFLRARIGRPGNPRLLEPGEQGGFGRRGGGVLCGGGGGGERGRKGVGGALVIDAAAAPAPATARLVMPAVAVVGGRRVEGSACGEDGGPRLDCFTLLACSRGDGGWHSLVESWWCARFIRRGRKLSDTHVNSGREQLDIVI